jgi:uridine kinase
LNSVIPCMIGIAGGTCSGKSRLAKHLEQKFQKMHPVIISCDAYYRDLSDLEPEERENKNFDVPEAIEVDLLVEHLEALAAGRAIRLPRYDFSTHTRGPQSFHVVPRELVIVEGLFVLYWTEIRRLLHTKVFVWLPEHTDLSRRLERDVRERGRTQESVLNQYHQTVKPMNEKYVLPTKAYADILVNGTDPVEKSADLIVSRMDCYLRTSDHAG